MVLSKGQGQAYRDAQFIIPQSSFQPRHKASTGLSTLNAVYTLHCQSNGIAVQLGEGQHEPERRIIRTSLGGSTDLRDAEPLPVTQDSRDGD